MGSRGVEHPTADLVQRENEKGKTWYESKNDFSAKLIIGFLRNF
jgi:hypothetical protein